MIMRGGQQLLLPASPTFIWASLLTALLLDMLPFGRNPWMPDFMALVLVFWNVHQPLRIGIALAFMFGLAVDVHQTALLGQHALSYTTLSFFCDHDPPAAAVVSDVIAGHTGFALVFCIAHGGPVYSPGQWRCLSGLEFVAGTVDRGLVMACGQRTFAGTAAPGAGPG